MTPRPDIVAIRDDATIGDLIALFREQEYSRFPVYKDSLDNIAGFVFVKDLVALDQRDDARPITSLLRPAVIVPESKRVPELLKQFQRQQTQIAIVVDEYGGTAGLVTIEDMLEEIVGEIRDEYDVESEPVVDEGGGRFLFHGKVDIDEVSRAAECPDRSRRVRDGRRLPADASRAACRPSASRWTSTVCTSRCSTSSVAALTRSASRGASRSMSRQRTRRAQ